MAFELIKRRLLSFLILSTLFLAWSLFVTGETTEKLTFTRDGKNIYGVVTAKHRKGQPFNFAKLEEQPPPIAEQPPPPPRRPSKPPPPSPTGPSGPNP
ncbi:hypothetical protein CMV_020748 [Castanea mollissima]|uniref:Proline-rich protein n=1 Tax=Castanea mollissima TaxID=60419 RepID=A0A8J4QKZ3_9ROSI|nr:hypothetical protein CMV_020748 [Castanea mollissima]